MFTLDDLKHRMDGAVSVFQHGLRGLRTGRASIGLLESVMVEAYGALVPINQVSSISAPEARMLAVAVWDKNMMNAVERAIRSCGLGLNPISDGAILRIPLPNLNEERRRELVKIAHQYAEQARVAIRHVRRDALDRLKRAERDSVIGQDESRCLADKVQKLTNDVISEIDKILLTKEAEIMTV
ncbi:MAG: ribosome recycling factor [Candidatus Tokpelaia sp. JSC085]|nr:MAG: ribosome recycling factor [Candidatus Tokpelaia sp. JSC085]